MIIDHPLFVLVVSFVLLWLATRAGARLRGRQPLDDAVREDFGVVQGATLTLLGLIIGFSFSMAIDRYEQRKNLEEEEANAIGTEYLRADLLPAAEAEQVRKLLVRYLQERVLFYTTRDAAELSQIAARTSALQTELWRTVAAPAAAHPTQTVALAVAGMNDVINSQGYTQAAWWNRIPVAAWCLMLVIAVFATALLGAGARRVEREGKLLLILPAVVAISFFLIADIDSPRGGVIRVQPVNLHSLMASIGRA